MSIADFNKTLTTRSVILFEIDPFPSLHAACYPHFRP